MILQKRILIVDDNDVNRMILARILGGDYETAEAVNGREALDYLNENVGDVAGVMLDLVMPVMSGYEFLEIIQSNDKLNNIPVIVSTGNGDKENERNALKLGAWDFITKPYDADIIKFRLKNAIDRSQLAAFEQLKYLAEYDVLTGIYNKNKFFADTEQMVSHHRNLKFAFVRFDVDRFSVINSYYGMEEGDLLLKKMAKWLQFFAKKKRMITYGRIEGDEFAFCMSYEDQEEILAAITESKETIRRFNISFNIVLTYGIYLVENEEAGADTMLDNANLAAKQIKGNYINNYIFYNEEMGKALEQEQEIVNEMTAALEQEQFVVYLQPKYNLKTNRPAGAEALVRWKHPVKGLISPGVFIPIFERNGFIEKLDYYMWEKTCQLLRKWLDQGINPNPISVNVSRVNIYNPKLVDLICGLTEGYRIPKELLQLELTESAYTDNPEMIQETMDKLHGKGFVVLMDDFGSGYSSLNVLKDIDVDIIKIDMGFMTESRIPGRGESIIASVVRMAKWLNIPIIAEGVEKSEQVEFLRGLGCEYIQGYYYARPMPTEEYESLARKNEVYEPGKEEPFRPERLWETSPEMEQLFSNVMQAVGIYEIKEESYEKLLSGTCQAEDFYLECTRVNNSYYELFGYEDTTLFTSNSLQAVHKEYRDNVAAMIAEVIHRGESGEAEYRRKCMNGKNMWIHMKAKYLNKVGNRHVLVLSFFDITEQKAIDLELQKYKFVMDNNKEHTNRLLIVDDQRFNRDLLGDIFAEKYEILKAENGQDAIAVLARNENNVELILLDMMMPVMDGTQFLEYKRNHVEIADIPTIIVTADDSPEQQISTLALGANDYITKPYVHEVVVRRVENVIASHSRFQEILKQYTRTLEPSQTDSLTGLYNLEGARNMIDNIFIDEPEGCHAMLEIDADHFATINAQYGRETGDAALIAIARVLKNYFRANDIVCRIGSDRFCVFMTSVPSKDMVLNKCQMLCEKISNTSVNGANIPLSVSIGVAVSDESIRSYEALFQYTSKATDQAKLNGRGRAVLYSAET